MNISADNRVFFKSLVSLAVPIIFQELLNSSVNMLDNLMVGTLGIYSVTAVGLANSYFFLFILILFGINSGASIFMGQFWGKKDVDSIHKIMGISVLLGLCVAFVFVSGIVLFPAQLMRFYSDGDPKVIELGVTYLKIVGPSYFLTAISVMLNSSLRSIRQTKFPAMTTGIALSCNFVLNYLFIFIFKWGVGGAALATLIARAIEAAAQIILIYKFKLPVAAPVKDYFKFDFSFVKKFFATTTPVILNEFIWALGTMLYSVCYKSCGTEGQGAAQIAGTVQQLFMVMGFSVGSSCAILLSNALGAGEMELAVSYSRKCMKLVTALSLFMGVMLLIFSPFLINIYDVSQSVKDNAFKIMIVIAVGLVFKTLNFTTIVGILRSGGDTAFCMILDAACVWLVGLPLLLLGAFVFRLPIYFLVAITYSEEVSKLFFSLKRTLSNVWAKSIVS